MARKFICDRCKAEFSTWATTNVEIPLTSLWQSKMDFDICNSCINQLRSLVSKFMEKK